MDLIMFVLSWHLIFLLCTGVQESPDNNKSAIRGWVLRAAAPSDYEIGIDHRTVHGGRGSGFLEYTVDPMIVHPVRGAAFLFQAFKPDLYRGKRIRVTAYLRSERTKGDAFLWVRMDGGDPIGLYGLIPDTKGDPKGWVMQECVVDVAPSTTLIAIGGALGWRGTIWLDDFRIEVVGNDVPESGSWGKGSFLLKTLELGTVLDGPVNLRFEE